MQAFNFIVGNSHSNCVAALNKLYKTMKINTQKFVELY
jgi:hypothetical protein